ncbi:MAG: MATE family efflux transporter [Eubacteriales bacterium]|nr:MATE family efflux transporter [Eubacteriales bacterium]
MSSISTRSEREGQERENPLASGSIWSLIGQFAVPAIVSGLVNSLYNIVDQIFIGQSVGQLGNAATNVSFPLVIILTAFSMMIGVGAASNFSLRLGEGQERKAAGFVGNSVLMTLAAGVLLMGTTLLFLEPMMVLFGARGEVLELAMQYTGITALGMPFAMITSALSQLIRADASPRYAMVGTLFGAVLNMILDPVFIFGFDMGIRGAALATILGQIVSAVIILRYFRKFRSVPLTGEDFRPRAKVIRGIVSLGMAACLNQLAVTVVQIVLNNALGHYGELSAYGRDIPLAAVGVVSKVNSIFASVMFGIAQSCQPIMGYNYGTGNYARVRAAYRCAAILVVSIGSAAFVCFQLFPERIVSIFGNGDALYYEFAVRYFRVFLFFVFLNGIQILTSSFFSSIGQPVRGTVMSLSRQVFLFLPLVLLLPLLWGIDGVLYAGPIADGCAAVVAAVFYFREVRRMERKA